MRSKFRYIRPDSTAQALQALKEFGPAARILAGGTDLLIEVREGKARAEALVDISRLEELKAIRLEDGVLRLGATATYSEIIASDAVRKHAPVLVMAAQCVGSVQIRNTGTVGGNVANANPAGDSVPALVAHKALAEIRSADGTRTLPVEEVIVGVKKTSLRPGELISAFLLEPMPAGYRYAWQRVARRRALSVARMSAAVLAATDSQGQTSDLRLSVGSVMPAPRRMTDAEQALLGKKPSPKLIMEASQRVSKEMIRISGIRSTTEYKRPAVEGLVIKALSQAFGVAMV